MSENEGEPEYAILRRAPHGLGVRVPVLRDERQVTLVWLTRQKLAIAANKSVRLNYLQGELELIAGGRTNKRIEPPLGEDKEKPSVIAASAKAGKKAETRLAQYLKVNKALGELETQIGVVGEELVVIAKMRGIDVGAAADARKIASTVVSEPDAAKPGSYRFKMSKLTEEDVA